MRSPFADAERSLSFWSRSRLETQRNVVGGSGRLGRAAARYPEQDWSAGWDCEQPGGDTSSRRAAWARALSTRGGQRLAGLRTLQKWSILGVVIGAVAGLGAIVFYEALVALHPLLPERLRRLPGADAGESRAGLARRRQPPGRGHFPSWRASAHCSEPSSWLASHRGRGARHRRRHLGGAPQPTGRPLPLRPRQDRCLGVDHRLGWLGGTRGPDARSAPASAHSSPAPRSPARRRPDRRGDRDRVGHRRHLRRAPGRRRPRVRDPLP